jgi:catechol 2,3-dioxygenase-like lactoylglutathione lyase family enzyme
MIARLAHICFKTNRVEEMLRFYKEVLALSIRFSFKNKNGEDFGYYFDLGNRTFLEIFDQKGAARQWGGDVKELEQKPGTPYQHFCLEVEDLAGFCRMLKDKGVAVTEIRVGMDNSRQAWITDPDGNRVELMEYTERSLQLSVPG